MNCVSSGSKFNNLKTLRFTYQEKKLPANMHQADPPQRQAASFSKPNPALSKTSPNIPQVTNVTTGSDPTEASCNCQAHSSRSGGSENFIFLASHGILTTCQSQREHPYPFACSDKLVYELLLSPREIMNMRWMKSMQEMLPTCDF